MIKIIGVRFRSAGKVYYFDPGDLEPVMGDHVIVETARGPEYGTVSGRVKNVADDMVTQPLRAVVRIATEEDTQKVEENRAKEKEALNICREKVRKHNLDMKLVDAEYSFDGSKILFYFTADGRIDFRDLVKDLASVFRMRIELRQIGVRDETKMLGGLGICGRELCCATYLSDFAPVSIKMAKEQNLSLNPAKISGTCGRLMCCLKNEEDTYEYLNSKMPKMGEEASTADGRTGKVVELNVLRQRAKVMFEEGEDKEIEEFPVEELNFRPRRRKGEKAEKQQENPKKGQKSERQDSEQADRRRGARKRAETENRPVKGPDTDAQAGSAGADSGLQADKEAVADLLADEEAVTGLQADKGAVEDLLADEGVMAGLLAGAAVSAAEAVLEGNADAREQLKIKAKETTVTTTELEVEESFADAEAVKAQIRRTEETVFRTEVHADGGRLSIEENREERKETSASVSLPGARKMSEISGQAAAEYRRTEDGTEAAPESGNTVFREDFREEGTEYTDPVSAEAEELYSSQDTSFSDPDAVPADAVQEEGGEWDGERRRKPRRRRHKYTEDGTPAEEYAADAEESASGNSADRKGRRNSHAERGQREERTERENRRKYADRGREQEAGPENRQRKKYADGDRTQSGDSAGHQRRSNKEYDGNRRDFRGGRKKQEYDAEGQGGRSADEDRRMNAGGNSSGEDRNRDYSRDEGQRRRRPRRRRPAGAQEGRNPDSVQTGADSRPDSGSAGSGKGRKESRSRGQADGGTERRSNEMSIYSGN
jgi:cell fate regulator YaaT (PSP1 superfamily)